MKSKLLLLLYYEVVFNSLYYKYYKEDEEKSKKLAYGVVRNSIGVMIFLVSIVLFVVITCVFKLNTNFLSRSLLYLISGVFIYFYYLMTEKFFKPLFDNVELKKEKPSNYNYEISVVLFSLLGGGMYLLGRLLTFYLCR